MSTVHVERTARAIVADGTGILAADGTPGTLTTRFEAHRSESTAGSRRAYRERSVTTAGSAEYIGGVILQDETIRQRSSTGIPFATLLAQQRFVPGVTVDTLARRRVPVVPARTATPSAACRSPRRPSGVSPGLERVGTVAGSSV